MRTYKLTVAYDGTAYQGWQRQANTDRTIQGILESCISEQTGYPVEVNGSGRTDAGVHAEGQTASVVLRGAVEEGFFTGRVNGILPEDIRILKAVSMQGRVRSGKRTNIILIPERRRMCLHADIAFIMPGNWTLEL